MIDSTVDSNGYSMVTPPGAGGGASRSNPLPSGGVQSSGTSSSGTHNLHHSVGGEDHSAKEKLDDDGDEEEFVQSSHYEDSSNDNTNDYSFSYGNLNTSKDSNSNSNSAQISTSGQVRQAFFWTPGSEPNPATIVTHIHGNRADFC